MDMFTVQYMLERGYDLPSDCSENGCSNGCSLPELYTIDSTCLAVICIQVWSVKHVASMLQSLSLLGYVVQ